MKNSYVFLFTIILIIGLIGSLYIMYKMSLYYYNKSVININSSESIITDPQCESCSISPLYELQSIFKDYFNYSSLNITLNLGTVQGNKIIKNDDITSLPSMVIPISIMDKAPYLVSGFIYDNIFTFNSYENKIIVNTPYLSELFGSIKYFSLIQNKTITSVNILNISNVYKNLSNFTIETFVNPMTVIKEINTTNLTYNGKPLILIISGNSPFDGLQSLILRDALLNFGTFKSNLTYFSSMYNITNSMTLGPQLTYNLGASNYSSKYFSLEQYDIKDLTDPTAQKLIVQYDQNLFFFYNSSSFGNFEPFVDIGGKYIIVSSFLKPFIFNWMNQNQVDQKLATNKTIAELFNRSVLFVDALLCSYTNQSQICSNNFVKNYTNYIDSAI